MPNSPKIDDAETLGRRVAGLEAALSESKARLQAAIDAAPSLIFVRDRDGRYVASNAEFARLHGLKPKDVEGKTPYDLCPTDVADAFIAAVPPGPWTGAPRTPGKKKSPTRTGRSGRSW